MNDVIQERRDITHCVYVVTCQLMKFVVLP